MSDSPPARQEQLVQVTRPWTWLPLAALGLILLTALGWILCGDVSDVVEAQGVLMREGGVQHVHPPAPAVVEEFKVIPGQKVQKGGELVVLKLSGADPVLAARTLGWLGSPPGHGPMLAASALIPRLVVRAPEKGLILTIDVTAGHQVGKETELLHYEPTDKPMRVLLFVPSKQGYRIEKGMKVRVEPASARIIESGYVLGCVENADRFPVTEKTISARLHDHETLVRLTSQLGPCLQVVVKLDKDKDSESGFKWSSEGGKKLPLYSGTPCQARVIVWTGPPISLVFPQLSSQPARQECQREE